MRTRKREKEREESLKTMGSEVFFLHTRREEEMYHHENEREDRSKRRKRRGTRGVKGVEVSERRENRGTMKEG